MLRSLVGSEMCIRDSCRTTSTTSDSTLGAFQTLVVALVHANLDYGNAVLADLPAYLQCHLQSVLNTAAWLIYSVGYCDHVTDAPLVACFTAYQVQAGGVDFSQVPCYHGPLVHVADVLVMAAKCTTLPTLTLYMLHLVHGTICQILLHLLNHYTLFSTTSRLITFRNPFQTLL